MIFIKTISPFFFYNCDKKGVLITYTLIHTIHLYSVFIYGGFLFIDNLFITKLKKDLTESGYREFRELFMSHVKKVVPWALLLAVASGLYLLHIHFGAISEDGLSRFQILLGIKAILGIWLGFRGINQKFFGIEPWVFKSHIFPFTLVIVIIALSQFMYL